MPFLLPIVEFALAFAVPREDYVKALCWSRSPPACSFEFSPSPVFFLAVALPFVLLTVLSLWRNWRETAILSGSAGVAVLTGTALLAVHEGIALPTVLLLIPILQWVGERVLKIQVRRTDKALWTVSAVLSFLAVWIVVRMGLAVSV
ncbi:hypothetical protein APY94_02290 [Thermococcus celericrescens]|uniref:Uncharacterized protein n=2 Tax=Thermococcus celericrescens TaxID=227598 RepID=A0A100XZC1_9EURY|nr:hypothetical protein APY94_02290 [Thermococcus celericrescens]